MHWIVSGSGITLLLLTTVINSTIAIQCYVCGDSNTFLGIFHSQQQNASNHQLSCIDFEKSEGQALEKYKITCPKQYRGCITQKQGDNILRACDTVAFDDCQSANGVTYCYCSGELCNGPGSMKLSTTSAAYIDLNKVADLTDDEDYIDMSGDDDPEKYDSNERSIVIKGSFDSEMMTSVGVSIREEEEESEHDRKNGTGTNEADDGNDFITTDNETIQLIRSGPILNTTRADTSSTGIWSTIPTSPAGSDGEIREFNFSTLVPTVTVGTIVTTTHIANVKTSSTRILDEPRGNGKSKIFNNSANGIIIFIVVHSPIIVK